MKTCTKCGKEKPFSEFYKHPAGAFGCDSKCKDCAKAQAKAFREANPEHYKAYDRARASRPDRVAARAAYLKTEAGRAATNRARQAYKERNPKRRAAQVALGNAVRDGHVTPWPACAVPECSAKPEAHHPNYDRPLDVVWLCPAHHKQAHALVGERHA